VSGAVQETRGGINFFNCDNMDFMKSKPDNYYDLAIVDPPYQIERFSKNMDSQGTLGKSIFLGKNKISEWDKLPIKEYFKELFRVSKNQIIWGANHFWQTANLPNATNFIFWDKKMPFTNFSRGELAWTSFKGVSKCFEYNYYGNIEGNTQSKGRIHPTQKPILLYRWLLDKYADKGMKILDTHGGSFTNAIACDMEGFDLDIIEIDKEYFNNGLKAFDNYKKQLTLF